MFGLALPAALPWKAIAKVAAIVAVAVAVVFGINSYGKARYQQGAAEERLVWTKAAELQRGQIEALQRAADQALAAARIRDEGRREQERKEVEDAIADIPDQGTSARQRARACLELRRRGEAPPACGPDTAP